MFKTIGRIEPNILCATDFLIGDMSDINYEYLLLNKPLILLSNSWLKENFPDIGHRIESVKELSETLELIGHKDSFLSARTKVLKEAFSVANVTSSDVALSAILEASQMDNPRLVLHHINNQIYKSNLMPLVKSARKFKIDVSENVINSDNNVINIGAHFRVLLDEKIASNFCVHLDHGLKGDGTANVEISQRDYKKNNFFPSVDLHLTAGPMGQRRTQMLLGPMQDRALIGAYPKATSIIEGANSDSRKDILSFYGLDPELPVITYAPAGENSFEKPGGSLSRGVLRELKLFEKKNNFNVVIKLKYPFYYQRKMLSHIKQKFKHVFFG